MPKIYEYLCTKCNNSFEIFKGQESACPKCGNTNTKKLFSGFSTSSHKGTSNKITPRELLQSMGGGEAGADCPICKTAAEITCKIINKETNN